jgi:hypothetical protein
VVKERLDTSLVIKDQADVRAMVEWLAELDAEGELSPLFDRSAGLTDALARQVVRKEG